MISQTYIDYICMAEARSYCLKLAFMTYYNIKEKIDIYLEMYEIGALVFD